MEKLKTVEIGGENLPIRCNIDCLIAIQDEFEDFKAFEQSLIGIKVVDGVTKYVTPSISAISRVLPMFIKQGLMYENKEAKIDYFEAIKEVDFNIIEVAVILFEEFQRCFYRKKSTALKSTTSESTTKRKKATK